MLWGLTISAGRRDQQSAANYVYTMFLISHDGEQHFCPTLRFSSRGACGCIEDATSWAHWAQARSKRIKHAVGDALRLVAQRS